MRVAELGEFGLIRRLADRLASRLPPGAAERLAVGIGDDAAVWLAGGRALIATTDTLVSGVHFLPDRTPWPDLGWKALAVNVSDVAAMGGRPDFALVTLALPPDLEVEAIDQLYDGLAEAAEAFGTIIAGGDVVRSPVLSVTVALVGSAEVDAGEPRVLRRDAGRAGDLVAVTGCLGGSAAGLRLLRDGNSDTEAAGRLVERHLRPRSRVAAGWAAVAAGARCAIDVSDGLLQDLGHICEASGVGAIVELERLPIDADVAELFAPDESLRLAATGGEDYELILTASESQIEDVRRALDVPVTAIGRLVADDEPRVRLLDPTGREVRLPSAGWDHLSEGPR